MLFAWACRATGGGMAGRGAAPPTPGLALCLRAASFVGGNETGLPVCSLRVLSEASWVLQACSKQETCWKPALASAPSISALSGLRHVDADQKPCSTGNSLKAIQRISTDCEGLSYGHEIAQQNVSVTNKNP